MRDTMVYRGPDDAGIYTEGVVGLAHRRLSIVDLSPAGHQPMTNEDSTLWLVFNGEIYNFVELASQLRRRGHRFRSDTDSEVILHLYEEHGEHCVKHLNGMFAFVIWDSRKRRLFGARDRTGIKPFHFCRRDDRFICASEIKAILEGEGTARIPDHEYFADYLYAGYSLGGKTPFRGIRQLLPGHCFTLQDGRFLTRKYWDVVHDYDHSRSDQQVIRELRELLDDSVRIHCRSDAPVGCHLSGGLDSSTVTAYAVRHRTPLKTFTIRFDGGKHFDESAYARAMAQHAGTEYIEATPDATELNRLLPALIWHLEAPMPTDGGFAYYTASHLAAQHVKVSLTGHGGDEIFAGYPAQFRAAFGTTRMFEGGDRPIQIDPPRLQRLRALFRAEGVSGIVHRIARRFAPAGDTLDDLWIALHCGATPRHNPLLHRQFVRSLAGYTSRDDYLLPLREASTDQVLDRCLYHDLRSYLPGLLHMEDRVSMAMSLESRVPLLDHRIIEFMATVPPEQKLRGHEPKALLRTAVGELLADEVRYRKTKTNFPVPVRSWLSGELAPVVRRIVLSPACLDRGILDADLLRRDRLTPGQLWAALNIELWFKIFIDRDPLWSARIGAAAGELLPAGAA